MASQKLSPTNTAQLSGTGPSFDAALRRDYQNVDFAARSGRGEENLPIPLPTDDIRVAMNKLRALADVVSKGKSVAIYTSYKGTPSVERDPVNIAKASMTDAQKEQYEAWASGYTMPTYDWVNNTKPLKGGERTRIKLERRVEATREIWGNNSITPQNVYWLAEHDPFIMPLITAVAKVNSARRNLAGRQEHLMEYELAEVQTIHNAIKTVTATQNAIMAELNLVNRSINEAKKVLQAREDSIKTKNPVNIRRERAGLPSIGAGVDFGAGTRGGRFARKYFSADTG
ncbi:hypothetical protein EV44_g3138 [Erysiphe necator]|uniref:Uncharacterized protein n=1 Tax=Uncinula necator TaxID=52586 RepID=A0A0B1P4V5_UNCNE|nr:hypothetical protein EV44_g3138 [Erysiphe necator]